MSTRIEAGRLWDKRGGLNKLIDELVQLREKCTKRVNDFYWEHVCRRTATIIQEHYFPNEADLKRLSGYDPEKNKNVRDIFNNAQDWVEEEMRKSEKSEMAWDSFFDTRFSVNIWERKGKAGYLLYPIYHNRELYGKLLPGKPYGYWNNVDEPKNVTRAEWNARGREWDYAIPYSLGDRGVNFEIVRRTDIAEARYKIFDTNAQLKQERKRRTKMLQKALDAKLGPGKLEKHLKKDLHQLLWGHLKEEQPKAKAKK